MANNEASEMSVRSRRKAEGYDTLPHCDTMKLNGKSKMSTIFDFHFNWRGYRMWAFEHY